MEIKLAQIMRLFQFLRGRDIFIKAYEIELANRLLNKTSISQEYEELILQKLKVECGAQEMKKMTQMMKDIQLSADIKTDFVASIGGSSLIEGVEFGIEILTDATWPSMKDSQIIILPQEMKACC